MVLFLTVKFLLFSFQGFLPGVNAVRYTSVPNPLHKQKPFLKIAFFPHFFLREIFPVEILEEENIIVLELCRGKTLESEPPKMERNYFHSINSNVILEECFQLSQCSRSQCLLQHRS